MIRTMVFLANRIRGKLLPIVYKLLNQENTPKPKHQLTPELIQKTFTFNPLNHLLWKTTCAYPALRFGKAQPELQPFIVN